MRCHDTTHKLNWSTRDYNARARLRSEHFAAVDPYYGTLP